MLAGLILCTVFTVGQAARAVEPVMYSIDGRSHRLVRAPDEFLVTCEESDGGAAMLRLNNLGIGRGTPVPYAYWPQCAILKVPAATRETRDLARKVEGVKSVRPVYRYLGNDVPMFSSGTAVVKLRDGITDAERDQMFNDYRVQKLRAVEGLKHTYIIAPLGDPDEDEVLVSAALHIDDRVAYAHPNFIAIAELRQQIPSDTYYAMQWHLNNTGQDGATPGADIDAPEAWMIGLGLNVIVGMLDDSCDINHEDLRDNYIGVGQDIVRNDGDPRPKLVDEAHGTAVMGLICAAANSRGTRGVAPLARFTASRGIVNEQVTFEQFASAYTFARQQNVDVHSNSWGFVGGQLNPAVIVDAIHTAFEQGRDPDGPQGPLPARGMVILFATGNAGIELEEGTELSTLPTVIGVGASNAADMRSAFSNYGVDINVLAPSNPSAEAETFLPSMVTTDNTDSAGYVELGYNEGGVDDFGFPNLPNPNYTREFGGTSAACPVAAGVAAIIIGINPNLTATQVRLILEHTTDQISPAEAQYSGLTRRSLTYGYGRVNAGKAATAAQQSVTNGNLAWPERPTNVRVQDNTILWANNVETERVMVVQSSNSFAWTPTDGTIYSINQEVAPGVTVGTITQTPQEQSYQFTQTTGTTYFALFAVNTISRYSFGVGVDSNGNVVDPGPTDVITGEEGTSPLPIGEIPAVTISATPLAGNSPLTVDFRGNAQTDAPVASSLWDFGDGTTSDRATTSHTYVVTNGTTQRFIATFTVTDNEDDSASRSIAIDVTDTNTSGDDSGSTEPPPDSSIRIIVGTPGSIGSDVDSGVAPFTAELSLDTTNLQGSLVSVNWDLGDGNQASSITVRHVYSVAGIYPISAMVTTRVGTSTLLQTTATRLITVLPGVAGNTNTNANSTGQTFTGGGSARSPCGVGMITLLAGALGLALSRRRW